MIGGSDTVNWHFPPVPGENGALFIAVGLSANASATSPEAAPEPSLFSLPGTGVLLRLVRSQQITTGLLIPDTPAAIAASAAIAAQADCVIAVPGAGDPSGGELAPIISTAVQQAGYDIAASAVITTQANVVDACRAGGFGRVAFVTDGAPAALGRLPGTPENPVMVDDTSELGWRPDEGLYVKTLETVPVIHTTPFGGLPDAMQARVPLLFLDYDGTLTPIINDPARAVLSDRVRATLAELGRATTVTIVSGRDLGLLQRLVDLDHLWYAGSHGYEIAGPRGSGISLTTGAEFLPALDAAESELSQLLRRFAGHLIERKRMTIAVHYRNMQPTTAERMLREIGKFVADRPALHAGHGKKVIELRPALDWHKGKAVTWIRSQLRDTPANALPVYIGDDLTDEDAFRELTGTGIGIAVRHGGIRRTAADFVVGGTDDVQVLLTRLLQHLRQG